MDGSTNNHKHGRDEAGHAEEDGGLLREEKRPRVDGQQDLNSDPSHAPEPIGLDGRFEEPLALPDESVVPSVEVPVAPSAEEVFAADEDHEDIGVGDQEPLAAGLPLLGPPGKEHTACQPVPPPTGLIGGGDAGATVAGQQQQMLAQPYPSLATIVPPAPVVAAQAMPLANTQQYPHFPYMINPMMFQPMYSAQQHAALMPPLQSQQSPAQPGENQTAGQAAGALSESGPIPPNATDDPLRSPASATSDDNSPTVQPPQAQAQFLGGMLPAMAPPGTPMQPLAGVQQAPNPFLMYPAVFPPLFSPAFPFPYRKGIDLALACDPEQLSEYQILVRKQLEIFEAAPEDVENNTQGRKKQVVLGQVGLRCKHCAPFPLRARGRGAVYYPAKLQSVYQAAQNMAGSHLSQACQQIPDHIKQDIRKLRERRDNATGGKQYWADAGRALGIYESEHGLKLGPRPSDKS